MSARNPQRPAIEHAKSVQRYKSTFAEFRAALNEARSDREPGCDWEVAVLTHNGSAFRVDYAGLALRYRFVVKPHPDGAQGFVLLEVLDLFDQDYVEGVSTEHFNTRGKTGLRYHDDGDELFINRPAGAREMFLIQVSKHLGISNEDLA